MVCGRLWQKFQSAPGQLAGRCDVSADTWSTPSGFNPRPANWPGDARMASCDAPISRLFQSAPGQLAGRCAGGCSANSGLTDVSIRARPIGRAMHGQGALLGGGQWFQSAPGQLAGRCTVGSGWTKAFTGFNPRPANWPGDARTQRHVQYQDCVSIRARPIGRAMRTIIASTTGYR